MSFYYQHVGHDLFRRDAPKSLGNPAALRNFSLAEAKENGSFKEATAGAQIWGLPFGAARAVRGLNEGSFLMLRAGEDFEFVGKVVHRWLEPRPDLSNAMWGDPKFSIVVAMNGQFVRYPWSDFRERLSFSENYDMRGNTARLTEARLSDAGFKDSDELFDDIITSYLA